MPEKDEGGGESFLGRMVKPFYNTGGSSSPPPEKRKMPPLTATRTFTPPKLNVTTHSPQPSVATGSDGENEFYDVLKRSAEGLTSDAYELFNQQLNILRNAIADPAVLYATALRSVQSLKPDVSRDDIIGTIRARLEVVEEKRSSFQSALQQEFAEQVTGNDTSIQQRGTQIADKQTQVKALNAEIGKLEEEIESLRRQSAEAKRHLDQQQRDFAAAADKITRELELALSTTQKNLTQ